MGFIRDFSIAKPTPGSSKTSGSKGGGGGRGFVSDFAPEPKESFQKSPDSRQQASIERLRRQAVKSGRTSFANSFSATQPTKSAINSVAGRSPALQKEIERLESEMKDLEKEAATMKKASYAAKLTLDKLRDEIESTRYKLESRRERLKSEREKKEKTDADIKDNKRLVSILEAKLLGPRSRAHDWTWGLAASRLNDCLDLELHFRLDKELSQDERWRLFDYADQKKSHGWNLQSKSDRQSEEIGRLVSEVKVLEKGLAALRKQRVKTENVSKSLGPKRESLQRRLEQLKDQYYDKTGTFYS